MEDIKICLSGILLSSGGYSEISRNLAEVLYDLKVLAKVDIRDQKNFQPMPIESFCSSKFLNLVRELAEPKFYSQPNVIMQIVPPFMMLPSADALNIGLTMFETRIPEAWYKPISNVKYMLVHDQFQKDLLSRTSPKLWNWEPWVLSPKDAAESIVVPRNKYFLSVGVNRVHKNQSKLIAAFKEFRKNSPEFYLVIKAIREDPEFDDYRADLTDDHIIVIPGPYSQVSMDVLYKNCFAFVSPSMCEGLDMPSIKASMCGKPIVVSRHSGRLSWIPEEYQGIKTIEIDMSTVANIHPRYREPSMVGHDCTVTEILRNLHMVVDNPGCYKVDIGGRFTQKACRKSMEKMIDILKSL